MRQKGPRAPKGTYEFPIQEVRFSEEDEPSSQVLRLVMSDGLKFFCHRNRAEYRDPELIGAIFNPEVKKLDCMKWKSNNWIYFQIYFSSWSSSYFSFSCSFNLLFFFSSFLIYFSLIFNKFSSDYIFLSGITFFKVLAQSLVLNCSAIISNTWLTARTALVDSLTWSPMGNLPCFIPCFLAFSNVRFRYRFLSTMPPMMYTHAGSRSVMTFSESAVR